MNSQNKMDRRKFLKLAGVSVGASLFMCGGTFVMGTRPPRIEFNETKSGGENEMNKVLVAYASKAGSTGEVAQAIGQALGANGTAVDVLLAKDVTDVSGYDAVVVGSAIRMGRWLPEATNLVKKHADALGELPITYFAVSGFLKDPEKRSEVEDYLAPVRAIREPDSIGLFAGKMDYSKLSFFEKMIVKMVGTKEGDWRDWDAIHAWAESLRPTMTGAE